jgi:hypothetical protein
MGGSAAGIIQHDIRRVKIEVSVCSSIKYVLDNHVENFILIT